MKNLMISFITLLICSCVICTQAQKGSPDPVRDVNGNQLLSGQIYYAIPATSRPGSGYGLAPYALPYQTCKYGVSQLLYELGNPLAFHQPSSVLGSPIYEHLDLNISFSESAGCDSRGVWRRGKKGEATEQYFVTIGGDSVSSEAGKTLGNAFQIRKGEDDSYKFVYCPETCISCLEKCEDVGFYTLGGVKRLAVTDGNPYYIKFRKYEPKPELAMY